MKILAIESSCDETSVAVVENGRTVLSNIISSQAAFHAKYGGVIPEMAARQHLETINYVIQEALDQANLSLQEIDAFAATLGPGLVGALLVGATAAKTLSVMMQKPFLAVNHLHAHVASNYLETDLEPPFLCLLISGGHTQILQVSDYNDIRILGETLDDAVGEAYDKVARIMGLPYPGGPVLDKLAQSGNPKAFSLPQAKTAGVLDFSYSGLKTAVLRMYEKEYPQAPDEEGFLKDLAASFQLTAVDVLVRKMLHAAETNQIYTLAVAGGVAANSEVRKRFQAEVERRPDWKLYIPKMAYCTDNAAMVGASAFYNPISDDISMEVFSRSKITAAASSS